MITLTQEEKDAIRAAVELISDPAKWTQNVCARNSFGEPVVETHPDAICWCAAGAISYFTKVEKVAKWHEKYSNIKEVFKQQHNQDIIEVNDTEGREAVIEKLKQLI